MRAFGTFLPLPGSKISTTERPHGAKLAVAASLHDVKHHQVSHQVSNVDNGREKDIIWPSTQNMYSIS